MQNFNEDSNIKNIYICLVSNYTFICFFFLDFALVLHHILYGLTGQFYLRHASCNKSGNVTDNLMYKNLHDYCWNIIYCFNRLIHMWLMFFGFLFLIYLWTSSFSLFFILSSRRTYIRLLRLLVIWWSYCVGCNMRL